MSDSDDNGGIARGRRPSSPSSSRESSPDVEKNRAATPLSDDGNMPDISDTARTPLKPDAPLLRQPVGFAWESSTAQPKTYVAAIPTKPVDRFLPGQTVGDPSTKSKAKPKPRKPRHYNDAFASHTGSWRVRNYVNDPNATPSNAVPNTGPYNSAFRNENTGTTLSSTASITETTPTQNEVSPSLSRRRHHTSYSSHPQASSSHAIHEIPQSSAYPQTSTTLHNQPGTAHHYAQADTYSQSPSPAPREYGVHMSSGMQHTPSPGPGNTSPASAVQSSSHYPPHPRPKSHPQPNHNHTQHAQQYQMLPLRILTILIDDVRTGHSDHQLAEVRVPLKQAEDPEDGFWADSQDVCKRLQESPSRIDGEAKVFTYRGKYRQFFLRVSADGQYDYHSANLKVSVDRTLDVIVEWPGAPDPQKSSKKKRMPSAPSTQLPIVSPSSSSSKVVYLNAPNPNEPSSLRKREADWSSDSSLASTDSLTPYRPPSQLTEEEQDQVIVSFVKPLLQINSRWEDFDEINALSIPEILRQFRFVEDAIKRHIPRYTPASLLKAPNKRIKKFHVLQSMGRTVEWEEDRLEIMALMKLYGPDGTRSEDPRINDVLKMIVSTGPRSTQERTKGFLSLLRNIDREWLAEHPEDAIAAAVEKEESDEKRQRRRAKKRVRAT